VKPEVRERHREHWANQYSKPVPFLDRFWSRVAEGEPDECWEWIGARGPQGYGMFQVKIRMARRAHRISYELAHGPIPEGMQVLHRCDNPPCVNPAHLRLGTARDNTYDMLAKGRHVGAAKTHCPQGHPYNEANTYVSIGANGRPARQCRTCRRNRVKGLL
jgi:hypothetical protein